MIFCEAFIPSARRLFHPPVRFPIADAHYAMGFAFLYEATIGFHLPAKGSSFSEPARRDAVSPISRSTAGVIHSIGLRETAQ